MSTHCDCRVALAKLYEYLDGELGATERQAIAAHLDACRPCLSHYEIEQLFHEYVVLNAPRPEARAAFKERLLLRIAQEAQATPSPTLGRDAVNDDFLLGRNQKAARRVFVTGATGFIGTHVVERLARAGHEMHCLVPATSSVSALKRHEVTLIEGDVTDRTSVLDGMRGCDWAFNLADLYSFWVPDKRLYHKVNVEGTRIVLESALEAGVAKVVHVSSAVGYGKPADCPFTEESTPGPVRFSKYAQTKYEGDLVAWELHEKKGLPLVVLYPGAVVGPADPKTNGGYVQDLMRQRLPARLFPDRVLTAVHVRDVAEAVYRAAEKQGNVGERYLVGKYRVSFRELSKMVSDISGIPLPKRTIPGPVALLNAALLTGIANVLKRPPLWGMSSDQIRTMKEGFQFDGSKAERELGITYTPIHVAVEEALASYRGETSR
jgi:dihydroflavonol-4-reductase